MPVKQVNRDDSAFCRVDKDYRQACRGSDHDELDFRALSRSTDNLRRDRTPRLGCMTTALLHSASSTPAKTFAAPTAHLYGVALFLGQGAKRIFAWLYL
jgi:hypothetical protein